MIAYVVTASKQFIDKPEIETFTCVDIEAVIQQIRTCLSNYYTIIKIKKNDIHG